MTRSSRTSLVQALRARVDRWGFPLGLAAIGLFFAVFSWGVERIGAEQPGDPGPVLFPFFLGLVLIAASARFAWSTHRDAPGESASGREERVNAIGERLMFWLIGGMLLYLLLLPYVGFTLTTLVGGALLLRALQTRLWSALFVAIVIVLFAKALFTWGFDVQLPEGILTNTLLM